VNTPLKKRKPLALLQSSCHWSTSDANSDTPVADKSLPAGDVTATSGEAAKLFSMNGKLKLSIVVLCEHEFRDSDVCFVP